PALSLKARLAGGQNLSKLEVILRQLKSLDANDRAVVEALSELHFMKAEASAKGAFNREIFSLSSKNPLADLNAAYGRYDRIRAAYETACVQAGASWCGPAMYQLARVSEQFTGSIAPLDIPRTLEPEMVKGFLARKKSIIDTVDAKGLAADDRSLQEANGGSTNPEWTGSILWQNASDWQSERVSGETGNGYIQWHASAN
ncbi:MAG: hypothetical protein NTV34_04205, partial [Proteobacteria bacterium]|nr:hypothetical protein [Pseudomonadota bacterium]